MLRHTLFLLLLSVTVVTAAAASAPPPPAVPLDELVAEVVRDNPELSFYQEAIAAAQAGQRSAAAWADPELALELGRKRARVTGGAAMEEGTAWSVSVSQTFEWPGRIGLRKAIANRDVELAKLGLAQFATALEMRARLLAFGLHAAQTKAHALREVADRFTALKETFLAREPAGITPLLETRVIEAQELVLQRRASAAELDLQASLIELNQLRGRPADTPLRVTVQPLQWHDAPDLTSLLAAARTQHFEYRLRLVELEQQGLAVRLARHERYPAISVAPFYSAEKAGERESTVGVGVSLPLPAGGRGRAGEDMAAARQRQAEAAVRMAERELERDVLTAAHTFATKLREMRAWAAQPVAAFREAAELADRHYRLGAVPVATYLELQGAYLDAVEALLETEAEALAAGLRLQLLTGGTLKPVVSPRS